MPRTSQQIFFFGTRQVFIEENLPKLSASTFIFFFFFCLKFFFPLHTPRTTRQNSQTNFGYSIIKHLKNEKGSDFRVSQEKLALPAPKA